MERIYYCVKINLKPARRALYTMEGYWNYTEPVTYRAVMVKILPVAQPPLHWQNAFAGKERQVVEVTAATGYTFLIDNADGMGWQKLQHGGGPDSPSRHIMGYELVRECNESEIVTAFDAIFSSLINAVVELWQNENYPDEFAKLQQLIVRRPLFIEWPTSSNAKSATYDPSRQHLGITFKNGTTYRYTDVPPETWKQLITAESAGSFIARSIKGKYQCEKLTPVQDV